jgi:hypothetical protein
MTSFVFDDDGVDVHVIDFYGDLNGLWNAILISA